MIRLTCHHDRSKDKAGKHNDRSFSLDLAPHIDKERVKDNKYWTWNDNSEQTFREAELEKYKNLLGDWMERVNEHYKTSGHPERMKEIEDYHRSLRTKPEDVIIQIGDRNDHVDGETLWEVAEAYRDKLTEFWGDNLVFLDMALHMDEETPHVHARYVWVYEEDGITKIGGGKAREAMGLSLPDNTQPKTKKNNSLVTFTAMERGLLEDICREKGIEIETTPNKGRTEHMETPEYRDYAKALEALKNEIEEAQREKTSHEDERGELERTIESKKDVIKDLDKKLDGLIEPLEKILSSDMNDGRYDAFLDAVKKKSKEERFREVAEMVAKEASIKGMNHLFNRFTGQGMEEELRARIEQMKEELRHEKHKNEIHEGYFKHRGEAAGKDFAAYMDETKDQRKFDKYARRPAEGEDGKGIEEDTTKDMRAGRDDDISEDTITPP